MNTDIQIDKKGWKKVTFGEVAFEPKESCKNPKEAGIEHVVGLEHIDSEDIHLRKSNTIEESTAFTKAFQKGDILFGRRRAYLKKAAIAEFSGICSGDITVFRAKENILPELLPFVVHNEKFFDYAVKHSAGGLSPRVKFKDLANYEFLLPPKVQQAQLAELLRAMDEVVEKEKETEYTLIKTLNSEIENEIHGIDLGEKSINIILKQLSNKYTVSTLDKLGKLTKGRGIPKGMVIESGVPCVRYGELYTRHHRIIRKFHSFIPKDKVEFTFKLEKNDILFAGSGETITEIGKSAAFTSDIEAYCGSDILIFRPDEMDGTYLGYLMNSQLVRQQLNKRGTGATVMHIYNSDLEKIKIPVISLEEQIQIGNKLEKISSNIIAIREKIENSKSLQKSLVNQIF